MKGRVLVTVLSAIAMVGCRTSIHIPAAQVPCVAGGKVRDLRGIEETVREKREVILHPPAGAVFMRAPHSGFAIAVPAYDEPLLAARGLRFATPVGTSLDVSSGGVLSLAGPDGTWTVPAASVGKIEINQFSPGKTAGLVTASVLGGAILTGAAVLIIVLIANSSRFDFGTGFGGNGPVEWTSTPPPHGAR